MQRLLLPPCPGLNAPQGSLLPLLLPSLSTLPNGLTGSLLQSLARSVLAVKLFVRSGRSCWPRRGDRETPDNIRDFLLLVGGNIIPGHLLLVGGEHQEQCPRGCTASLLQDLDKCERYTHNYQLPLQHLGNVMVTITLNTSPV